jgi:predicted unusual protein kinase regulating ubiquinone biosynthesis (AarF/ABC1/UbiB family)
MPSSSGRTLLALLGGAGVATFLWSQARMDNEPGALAPLPLSTRNGSDYAAVTAAAATAAAASAAAATEDPLADHKLPPLIKEHRKLPFWRRMWFYIRIISRGVLLASIWVPALSLGIVLPTGTWVRLLVRLLERCGAVFIKLGQWAATRPDLFPEEACEQFAQLQASVKPHPFEQSVKACVDNFGPHLRAPDGSTLEIMPRVLGSGSMGQVHHGYITTPDGAVRTEVAIKVLHPGIHSLVNLDLTLLYFVARGITMIPYAELQWLSVPEMLVQFTEFMSSHLDLISEAHNMSRFRKNFEEKSVLYFSLLDRC